MKPTINYFTLLLFLLSTNIIHSQFRKKYELNILFEDFKKFEQNHDFYGSIIRVDQGNSDNKVVLHNIDRGSFPESGLKRDVKLDKNENIELLFYLSKKGTTDVIESFHKSYSAQDLENIENINFQVPTETWKAESMTTQDFVKFIKNTVFTREQQAITNSSLFSELTSLPLGAYIFLDKKTGVQEKLELLEFETIIWNTSIPKNQMILKFNKIVCKENNGKVDASFSQSGVLASVSTIIESSEFVEINMNLDSYYKKYIRNLDAIQLKYLTTNQDSLHPWFADKIERIKNSTDRSRYELYFTTGYKIIDNLAINYNAYKKFENENNIDLQLFEVVTAEAGAKLTRYKSTKDTILMKEYVVDVETENLTEAFFNLVDHYKSSENEQIRKTTIYNNLKASNERLDENVKLFIINYNEFLNNYKSKTLSLESFSLLTCSNTKDCMNRLITILNDLQTTDFANTIIGEYQYFLINQFKDYPNIDLINRSIAFNSNILNSRFELIRSIASEISSTNSTIVLLNSQINSEKPINYSEYIAAYYKENELGRNKGPVPSYMLPSCIK